MTGHTARKRAVCPVTGLPTTAGAGYGRLDHRAAAFTEGRATSCSGQEERRPIGNIAERAVTLIDLVCGDKFYERLRLKGGLHQPFLRR